jgi:hypothetical protein
LKRKSFSGFLTASRGNPEKIAAESRKQLPKKFNALRLKKSRIRIPKSDFWTIFAPVFKTDENSVEHGRKYIFTEGSLY